MVTREEVIEEFKLSIKFSLLAVPFYLEPEKRKQITDRQDEMIKYLEENLK